MFVPKAPASSAGSLRNPRRRPRTSSDESVKPPKAKRQRSVLRQENIEASLDDGLDNEIRHTSLDNSLPVPLNELHTATANNGRVQKHIVYRGPKKSEKQKGDIDGSVILSKTDFYEVTQLPALPDQIRGLQTEPLRCLFSSSNGYALALTRSYAIVWPYSTTTSTPAPEDIYTLLIPDSCRDPMGQAPLGVILSAATKGPPGLMVIAPSTGKIVYWETVSSATLVGLSKQKQHGLQGAVPGLLSGEYAIDILSAEPSGIIITFSSGRVAHVTVRDSQGKPSVIINFLRSTAGISSGGFFSGIKNVLGGSSWRREVTATRAGMSHQRGQRDVIVATNTGLFEVWDTHWNNGSILKRQFHIAHEVCDFLGPEYVDLTGEKELRVLDFVCLGCQQVDSPSPQEPMDEPWSLFILVAPPGEPDSTKFAVVQVTLSNNQPCVISGYPVGMRKIPSKLEGLRPILLVPQPGETAFIIFGQSVTVLLLKSFEETPSSQLLTDSNRLPLPFQGSINFQDRAECELLGVGCEEISGDHPYPACLLMVRGFGVVRVGALPRQDSESRFENAHVTAKSKLEQAIFYGTTQGNPLNLVDKDDLEFPTSEVEQAALDICSELLRSKSNFIASTGVSLDQNLRLRIKALEDLASLLMQQGTPLSRLARWELLWGAEKLSAQKAMWKVEDHSRKSKKGNSTFLARVISLMSDKFKTEPDPDCGDSDFVRQWFLCDTYRMDHIIPWIFNTIKAQKGNSTRTNRKVSDQILEASQLSLAILETAFQYRDEHFDLFGLSEEVLEDGVLETGYENLPEIWTSRSIGYAETGHLLDLELDSCRAWIQQTASAVDAPDTRIIPDLARNSARHLRVLGRIHCERVRWLAAQGDPKLMDESVAIERAHVKQRKWQLFKLAGIGHLEDAISLAERFRDMGALVELIIELRDRTKEQKVSSGETTDVIEGEAGEVGRKVSLYFEKFGESWADAFFSRQITMNLSGVLLSMRKFQPFITRFLRKYPSYSRLSWMNDVMGENDYDAAARSLEKLAIETESDVWSHRVELSLAKLTKLAASEQKQIDHDHSTVQVDVKRLDDRCDIDVIQDLLYDCISPTLHGAIDHTAEIDLAIDQFGKSTLEDRPSLCEILKDIISRVISRQVVGDDQLIDLLTLIDPVPSPEYTDGEVLKQRFYLALRVLHLSGYAERDPSYHAALQRLVWKRCMIQDNWEIIGKPFDGLGGENESLIRDTALFCTLTLCYEGRSEGADHFMSVSPSEILSSTSDPELLVSRFRAEQRLRILRDLQRENETLRQYIEIAKLDVWFDHLLASIHDAALPTANLIDSTRANDTE